MKAEAIAVGLVGSVDEVRKAVADHLAELGFAETDSSGSALAGDVAFELGAGRDGMGWCFTESSEVEAVSLGLGLARCASKKVVVRSVGFFGNESSPEFQSRCLDIEPGGAMRDRPWRGEVHDSWDFDEDDGPGHPWDGLMERVRGDCGEFEGGLQIHRFRRGSRPGRISPKVQRLLRQVLGTGGASLVELGGRSFLKGSHPGSGNWMALVHEQELDELKGELRRLGKEALLGQPRNRPHA